MDYEVSLSRRADKQFFKVPKRDQVRIREVLESLKLLPRAGDLVKLGNGRYRRRVGNWRIFFTVSDEHRFVIVHEIRRRTSKTYS